MQVENDKSGYNYGIIIFTPHRQGWLGIMNSYNSYGVYENPAYAQPAAGNGKSIRCFQSETLGYFMGSGDDEDAARTDPTFYSFADSPSLLQLTPKCREFRYTPNFLHNSLKNLLAHSTAHSTATRSHMPRNPPLNIHLKNLLSPAKKKNLYSFTTRHRASITTDRTSDDPPNLDQ